MAILMFLVGAVLLIFSAEKLVGYLVGVASGLRISVFFLAILFTGIEFDDLVMGVVLNLEDLDDVAMGIVFGTAISMIGVVLALAALVAPGKVNIPRDYLWIFAASPLVMVPMVFIGELTWVHGLLLIGLFVIFVAYITKREFAADRPIFRDQEIYENYVAARQSGAGTDTAVITRRPTAAGGGDGPAGDLSDGETTGEPTHIADKIPFANMYRKNGWVGLALALLALAGLIIGAAMVGEGTEEILESTGMNGTIFGATIATLVLTVEDIMLTVRPAIKGAPEIGIANVIGSAIFSVTGKFGVILLAGSIVLGPGAATLHLPALIIMTWVGAYFISTGRLQRWHGAVLLGLYVLYWIISFTVFDFVPVETD